MSADATMTSPNIAILLGTYNGARFLRAQLRSIETQTVAGWAGARLTLYVSDDGSSDATLAIIEEFSRSSVVNVVVGTGPMKGFAENYRHLILTSDVAHDFFLFCDQDDLWHGDKIESGIAALGPLANGPAMVCGRTLNIDAEGLQVGLSPLFARPPSFRNALVQSIAGANTMMINRQAFELLRDSVRHGPFVSHDWWTYLIVTGAGGRVVYAPEPTISYRQHGGNLVGANTGLRNKLQRLWRGFHGTFREWNLRNTELLSKNSDRLTIENRSVLAGFCRARGQFLLAGVIWLRRSGVYRQTALSNLHLYVACAFAKL